MVKKQAAMGENPKAANPESEAAWALRLGQTGMPGGHRALI
jgi:hypothetical protein